MNVNLDDLNAEQKEAVTAKSAHQMILAGAGTGKTTVLTRRIAWMIGDKGVPPERIMAVTFTNKARNEMKERIENLMGGTMGGLWIGTFHGIASRLLRRHGAAVGLPPHWLITDAKDQRKIVDRVIDAPAFRESGLQAQDMLDYINDAKNKGKRPTTKAVEAVRSATADDSMMGSILIDPGEIDPRDRFYAAYQETCDRVGAVDFGELLVRCRELFDRNEDLRDHYRNRFRHLLVDEFQDTNKAQYQLVKSLTGPKNKVWVVGDDDQSIYGWCGAEPDNMMLFNKDFAHDRIVRLEQNYRSTSTILSCANSVISNNEGRIGKELRPVGDVGDPIDLVVTDNPFVEARQIAATAKQWIDSKGDPNDIGILYRTSFQSRLIEQALAGAGIHYVVKGSTRFFEREEVRDAVGYMRLIRSHHDDVAFTRILNKPARGLGERAFDTINERASERSMSLWSAVESLIEDGSLKPAMNNALTDFVALIEDMSAGSHEMSVSELAEICIERSGLKGVYEAKGDDQSISKAENLDELVEACAEHGTIEGFLDETSLDANERLDDGTRPAVQLMTMHSAKGLEFPLVVLAGMDDAMFPHPRNEDLSEERRLAYVAVTRAKQKLVMTYPADRAFRGQSPKPARPSPFIDEMPSDLIVELDQRERKRDEQYRRKNGNFQRKSQGGQYRKRNKRRYNTGYYRGR